MTFALAWPELLIVVSLLLVLWCPLRGWKEHKVHLELG